MRLALTTLALAATLLAAGCSVQARLEPVYVVSTDELEAEAMRAMTELAGRAPDAVECPDRLTAEEGAEVRCTLTDGDDRYGVTVVVTGVGTGEDDVSLEFEVDEQPLPAGS